MQLHALSSHPTYSVIAIWQVSCINILAMLHCGDSLHTSCALKAFNCAELSLHMCTLPHPT